MRTNANNTVIVVALTPDPCPCVLFPVAVSESGAHRSR